MGAPHPIIVEIDHMNLGFYKQMNQVTPRQARWLSLLQEYDLLWEYIPGPKLIQGDALSRQPDHVDTDKENDKEFYILIPPECIISTLQREYDERIMEAQLHATMTTLADEIKHPTEKDHFASLIKSNLATGKTLIKSDLSDWTETEGVY